MRTTIRRPGARSPSRAPAPASGVWCARRQPDGPGAPPDPPVPDPGPGAPPAARPHPAGRSRRSGPRRVLATTALMVVVAAAALALWAVLPALLPGWSAQAVTSGSMAPLIRRGDVVVTGPAARTDLTPPRVAVYRDEHGGLVTHRIVDRLEDGSLVTRGDANAAADAAPVRPDRVVGVGRVLVPVVGYPAVWLAEGDHGRLGLTGLAVLLLLGGTRAARGPGRRLAAREPAAAPGRLAVAGAPGTVGRLVVGVAVLALVPWSGLLTGQPDGAGWWPAPSGAHFTATTAAKGRWETGTWMSWWDERFAHRLPLTVTTGPTAPYGGYAGYTVHGELDTASLVSAGRLRADCADLRVTRWDGQGWTELDRLVDGCGETSTQVRFALSHDLADDTADDTYWIHLDHPGAGPAPADPGAVHLFHDDFSGTTPGQPPAGWTATGGDWQVVDEDGERFLRLVASGGPTGPGGPGGGPGVGTPTIHLLQVDGLEERDVRIEARLRVDLANDQQACVATRMRGGLAGDLRAGCVTRSGAQRDLELLRTVDGQTSVIAAAAGAWSDGVWQWLGLGSVADQHLLEHGRAPVLAAGDPPADGPGAVGLRASAHNRDLHVDEVIVRRAAPVEPAVDVGELEPRR